MEWAVMPAVMSPIEYVKDMHEKQDITASKLSETVL